MFLTQAPLRNIINDKLIQEVLTLAEVLSIGLFLALTFANI